MITSFHWVNHLGQSPAKKGIFFSLSKNERIKPVFSRKTGSIISWDLENEGMPENIESISWHNPKDQITTVLLRLS